MRVISVFALSVFLAFYSSGSFYAEARPDKDGQVEAEKLLRQAVELTDIRSSGSHVFRFTARVKLFDEKGQPREGAYDLFWKSPTDWQDKLRIGDFSQVRTAAAEKLFVGRSTPGLRLEVFQALKLLEFPDLLRLSPEVNAQKLQERTRNGSRERTIQLARPGRPAWKTIFFDGSSPIPIRVEYKNSHFGYQFADYVAFNGHQFPRLLTEFDSSKTLIEVQVQELTEATIDESTFIPSPDSHWFHWCPHPEHATSLEPGKALSIPWPLRDGALKHPVDIYGIIGTDGKWHNLTVVKSAGKEADSYWMNEMLQERFSPARCGEVPIEQESVIENKLP
jgi:hypothetical protein